VNHTAICSALDDKKIPWMALLDEALNTPGTLSQAYRLFHPFSVCNQMLALCQLPPEQRGPLKTFKGWQELGRTVRKGEKAIALYMPFIVKKKEDDETKTTGKGKGASKRGSDPAEKQFGFMLRRNWFSLAQTEGAQEPTFDAPPDWNVEGALAALNVTRVPFTDFDGDAQGYAMINGKRELAISPLCAHPMRTLFHELAHLDLHVHSHAKGEPLSPHGEILPNDVREVEAETVSYLVADALGVEMDAGFVENSRAYIQGWMQNATARADFAKTRASRVFGCAQRIIAAGKPKKEAAAR